MSSIESEFASYEQRLCKQIHCFSELSEVLTLRLLEIEEKLKTIENSQVKYSPSNDTENNLLNSSEEKIHHLKNLLIDPKAESIPLDLIKNHSNANDSTENLVEQESGENSKLQLDYVEDQTLETEYVDDPQIPLIS